MNSDLTKKAAGSLRTVWGCTKICALNTMRRVLILGRYILICAQQQRLRRAQRRLGGAVLQALEQGEVNPMLAEGVKDALEKAKAIKAGKDKHYQAIAAIRERIRSAGACESPPKNAEPPPEGG
ncbi:MAG: hypothetical protein AB1424_00615 [Thermodesulfobacteriota bacterium]